MTESRYIYRIAAAADWAAAVAAGVYRGAAADARDGFLHFSTAAQLAETARRHYAGKPDLLLLTVDATQLALVWEPSRGGDLFPHLYGSLPTRLASSVVPLATPGA